MSNQENRDNNVKNTQNNPEKEKKRKKRKSYRQRKRARERFAKTPENAAIREAMAAAVYPTREDAREIAIKIYDERFKNSRLYHGNRRQKKQITPGLSMELSMWCARGHEPFDYFTFKGDQQKKGVKHLRRLFYEKNPALQGKTKYVSEKNKWVNIDETLVSRHTKLWKRVVDEDMPAHYTTERILELIEGNKRYPFLKANRLAKEAIRKQIPERISELFPLARSMNRHFILHVGPTNSGKTYDAITACERAEYGVYLAPLRLLAMEVAERMNADGVPCNMITGEEEQLVDGANHTASTIEMLSEEMVYDVAVIDECQLIADRDRGWAWTQAMLGVAAKTVHVCMAPEAEQLVIKLIEECDDTYEVRRHYRATPLIMERKDFEFPDDVRQGDALVVFSRKNVLQAASMLEDLGKKVSVIYGALPYEARRAETQKFLTGATDMVVATDAIGMGMNLPIKRIVFLETRKFDGISKRDLTSAEIKQIAGRAGRRGFEEKGLVNAAFARHQVAQALYDETPPIEKARTTMPRFLVNMERPLSQTMQDWQELPEKALYEKTDMSRAIKLCVWLEENCPMDKADMLRAITIPFEEDDKVMLDIWQTAMQNFRNGDVILNGIDRVSYDGNESLDDLEKKYKYLDLLYYLQRSFGEDEFYADYEKRDILHVKSEVSEAIIERLKDSKKVYKRCRICGKILPWNDPYRICNDCFRAKYHIHTSEA